MLPVDHVPLNPVKLISRTDAKPTVSEPDMTLKVGEFASVAPEDEPGKKLRAPTDPVYVPSTFDVPV